MSRIAYVSGRYVPHRLASIHIEDRGYQFADGVYEVIAVHRGQLVDEALHFERLDRSLRELRIAHPVDERVLRHVLRRVVSRNGVHEGIVYLQITRGVAPRDHGFPAAARPQLVITAKRTRPVPARYLDEGVKIVTIPEERWARRDIKSVSLLPNVLGKQAAREQGAYEAWQVEADNSVTEGTSSNAWIVTQDGEIVTRPATHDILNGVTRLAVIELARDAGMRFAERSFTVAEALAAREAFVTSTTVFVLPVTQIDDTVLGNGRPGLFTMELRASLLRRVERQVEA